MAESAVLLIRLEIKKEKGENKREKNCPCGYLFRVLQLFLGRRIACFSKLSVHC